MADDDTTSTGLHLYGMSSPNVRKVCIMLEELDLPYTAHHVAVFVGEQFESDFLSLNPVGKVPVLVDDVRGITVFESGAILMYLAETFGRFLPREGAQRYEVIQWLMVQMASIGPMFGQHNHFQLLPSEAGSYAAARYSAQAARLYRQLDTRLDQQRWLAGDAYSIADIATYPWALYLERHGFDPEAHPSLIRWRNSIGQREAVARTAARFTQQFETSDAETRKRAKNEDFERLFARRSNDPPMDYSHISG